VLDCILWDGVTSGARLVHMIEDLGCYEYRSYNEMKAGSTRKGNFDAQIELAVIRDCDML